MSNLGLLSKYRTELMGVATLLIILCHMPAHGVVMPSPLSTVLSHGGAGCDIFLFLSGLGMYRSLSRLKTSGGRILSWYKRRFARVLVPYLMICIPCFVYYAIVDNWPLTTLLLRLGTLSYWTEGWGLWYVALTLILYLLTPVIDKINSLSQGHYWMWLLVLLSWSFGFFPEQSGVMEHVQFVLCRVPCFLLGYMYAKSILAEENFNIKTILIVLASIYVLGFCGAKLLKIHISLFWIEGMLLTLLSTCFLHQCSRFGVWRIFRFLGDISLESYCTNVFVLLLFRNIPWHIGGINFNPGNWTYYIMGTLCCLLISVLVHKETQKLLKALKI